jgi:hypothetical protein
MAGQAAAAGVPFRPLSERVNGKAASSVRCARIDAAGPRRRRHT